jgi:hypothetical protein
MFDLSRKHRWFAFGFVFAWALSHRVAVAQNEKETRPAPSDRIRRTLEQVIAFDYNGQSFREAMEHLQSKTNLPIVIDPIAVQSVGLIEGVPAAIEFKNVRGKVRQALQNLLHNYGLTYVVLEDTLLITTEESAFQRQMRQRVPVDLNDVPASKALRDLARQTGISLVIDPRVGKATSQKVTLELDEATVETSLRLVAEFVDLKAVRMGNVIFVTDAARAAKIRKEEPAQPNPLDPRAPLINALGGALGAGFIGGVGAPAIAVPAAPAPPVQAPPPENKEEKK